MSRPVRLRIGFICKNGICIDSSRKFEDLNVFCKYKHFLRFVTDKAYRLILHFILNDRVLHEIKSSVLLF